jgi:membrane-associated phospholipid phosphatase
MFCYALNTAIVWRITKYWKISIHLVGIGGPVVALWIHGYKFPILMAITIFIIAISRVRLGAHTVAQVIAGTALAIILAYLELSYLFL